MIEVKERYTEKELLYLKGFLQGKKYSAGIRALNIASTQHGEQMRKSGDLYISHPIRIANALISLGIQDENIIILALLHDVLEDTKMTKEEVRCIFGEYIEKQLLLLSCADYIYYMKYHIESILETTKFFIKKDK